AFLWPAVAVAGQWNPTASDSNSNTAAGTSALETHGSGGYANTAMGKEALFHNNGGDYNTASGIDALFVNTTGTYNTANGGQALFSKHNGGYNNARAVTPTHRNTTQD